MSHQSRLSQPPPSGSAQTRPSAPHLAAPGLATPIPTILTDPARLGTQPTRQHPSNRGNADFPLRPVVIADQSRHPKPIPTISARTDLSCLGHTTQAIPRPTSRAVAHRISTEPTTRHNPGPHGSCHPIADKPLPISTHRRDPKPTPQDLPLPPQPRPTSHPRTARHRLHITSPCAPAQDRQTSPGRTKPALPISTVPSSP